MSKSAKLGCTSELAAKAKTQNLVEIMFRHLLNHEMFHAYRIEELLLKKDWE